MQEQIRVYVGGVEVNGFAEGDVVSIEREIEQNVGTGEINLGEPKETIQVRYCVIGAGPVGHPQDIFGKICKQQRWTVVEAEPHMMGDCWIFKVHAYESSINAYLPSYIDIIEG